MDNVMHILIRFLNIAIVIGCLFALPSAQAGTEVYFDSNDRFIVNGSPIIALPNTPIIVNGVIYSAEPMISESELRRSIWNGNMSAPSRQGSMSVIYRGVIYQIHP